MTLGKALLASLGVLATVVGLIGVVVPLLPTTPLLLLAAACFIRSSDRLYNRLVGNRWFGRHVRGYLERRVVPWRTKLVALVMLWGTMLLTISQVGSWGLRGVLALIAAVVTFYVLRLRSDLPEATDVDARSASD